MTSLRCTPASQNLSFQFSQLRHELFILNNMLFEFSNTLISSKLINFEWVCPFTSDSSWNIVIVSTNVNMVFILQPLEQIFVPLHSKMRDFDIDHSSFLKAFFHLFFLVFWFQRFFLLFLHRFINRLFNILHFFLWPLHLNHLIKILL